jgi:hypothetical protein
LRRVDRAPCTEAIHPPLADLLRINATRRDFNSREAGRYTPVASRVNAILPPVSGREVRSFVLWKIAMARPILLNLSESPKIPRVELNVHARNRAGVLGQRLAQHVTPRLNTGEA